jgi:outer membrane protein assembly factor BamB
MRVPLLLLSLAVFADDHNWPQFRGPGASGIGAGSPPAEWDGASGRNILWKTPIPGLGHSSPAVWGDLIFVTSAVPIAGEPDLKLGLYGDIKSVPFEGAQSFTVYAVNRKTGAIAWKQTALSGEPKVKRHPKSSHANPTVATDGRRVIALFGSEGLYAFDMSGKLLWKKDLGLLDAGFFMVPGAQWGYSSSPVLHDNVVIVLADVQKDSFLAAFDAATGKELWRTTRADVPTFGTPAVVPYTAGGAKGMQVVVNGFRHSGGYDFKTGKQLWKLTGGGDIPVPTPVFADGVVILTSAHGPARPIYAIRTDAAGEVAEGTPSMAWKVDRAGNYMQTPLVHGGVGYFCYDNGVLTAYQLANGERLYQQRLGDGKSGFSASPVAAAGRLYVTSEEGRTYVIALGREYKLIGENDLGEQVMATPALSGDLILIRGRRHMYGIGGRR